MFLSQISGLDLLFIILCNSDWIFGHGNETAIFLLNDSSIIDNVEQKLLFTVSLLKITGFAVYK